MVKGNEDPFSVLRLLESTHGFESCIEVTDVRFKSVCGCRNTRILKVPERITASFLEAQENIVVNGIEAKYICFDESFKMLPAQRECCW